MWALLIMFIGAPDGMQGWHYLNSYKTEKACIRDLHRVKKQMRLEYPGDQFELQCSYAKEMV